MATAQLDTLMRHIKGLAVGSASQQRTDRQLLEDFSVHRDESAFAALLSRHGPMVLRVCRRVLQHEQDAEDAFQATFLVLARNAGSIRQRDTLSGWLCGVAYRAAMDAKRNAVRRRNREARLRERRPPAAPSPTWEDVQAVLDEEIQRLPLPFRAAFISCVLDGKTVPAAACELGVKEGTLSWRLTRARQRLRQQLARRGIQLSAVLAALALVHGTGKAAVPAALANATMGIGLLVAAGEPAAGVIPSNVAALAAGVTRAMFLTRSKIAVIVLLAAGLIVAGAGALTCQALAAKGPEPLSATEPAPDKPAAPADKDAVTYAGRVLGPDGKPVADARVYYSFITREAERVPVRATTAADGRFSFTLTQKDVPLSADATQSDPLRTGQVVVKAEGFTFAWAAAAKPGEDLSLQLAADDVPVEGRIVDLQGKPLAGLQVSALSAAAPMQGDLSAFVKALAAGETLYIALGKHMPNSLHNRLIGRSLAGFLPTATTDADGRFRLPGFAGERLVELRVEGPTIETQNLFVLTRAQPDGSKRVLPSAKVKDPVFGPGPSVLVFWNGFDHAVAPCQTVTGTVRDESTGRPIPRAIVESYVLAGTNLGQNTIYTTVADDEGRYQFTGLPRGKGNRIRIRPPKDLAYLPVVKEVPPSETFARATVDAALTPGVWVEVTAADKATGRPVPGYVSYFVLPEKWDAESRFRHPYDDAYNHMMAVRNDGTFRFVAVPGKAVVAFRADWNKYPIAREASTIRLPSSISPSNYQAFAEINPKPGEGPVKVAFTLGAEGIVKGKVLDPDGQPLVGALAAGLRHDWFTSADVPLRTAEFTALGLAPTRPRLLCFAHPEKKLAGSVVVRGDETDAVPVRLQPWATVSGRLLDAEGKPIRNATLAFLAVPVRRTDEPRPLDTGLHVIDRSAHKPNQDPKTDAEGRFRVEGLIPGLKYNLALYDPSGFVDYSEIKWDGLAFSKLILKPGEEKDLGDVKLQPLPKE
jgi:RNA polymerase sigma factor (sigma-70 family)